MVQSASAALEMTLRDVARRLLAIGAAVAAVVGAIAFVVALLLAMWLDLVWELPAQWRIGAWLICAAAALCVAGMLAARRALETRGAQVAHLLDRVGHTGGEILSGWELDRAASGQPAAAGSLASGVTSGLARIAVAGAASRARQVSPASAVPVQPVKQAVLALGGLLLCVGLIALIAPGPASTQLKRFLFPFADVPPYSPTQFIVEPGNVQVPYGDPVEVFAQVVGAPVDSVELVLVRGQHEQPLPMFHDPDGKWRTTVTRVIEPMHYYVRAYRARSHRYMIDVQWVPLVTDVQVRVTPPEYARLPVYEGEVPEDGISGLARTQVELQVKSNRPLAGGEITVRAGEEEETFSLQPTADDPQVVTGSFSIRDDGQFEIGLVDVEGRHSRENFSAAIHRLVDQRPYIRVVQPQNLSFATPTAMLPVEVTGEDDFGVARIELYRSLNDSRPLATELPISLPPPRSTNEITHLPLSEYGLQEGDEIKLFARALDNDPDGPKGAESNVVTVHIISQETFEQMVRTREGINELISKYAQAQRRLESLANQLNEAAESTAEESELREKASSLAEQMREHAQAVAAAAQHSLPYDIDDKLKEHLEEVAEQMEAAAQQLEEMLEQMESGAASAAELQQAMQQLASQMSGQREQFNQAAMQPLEHLESILPLMAAQSRFVALVQRQQEIADRMAALRERDGEDDPALRARMRELQDEQEAIREALAELLDDIDYYVELLPELEEFDELRATASEFSQAVRGSGADRAMSEAEGSLSEFRGTPAHASAQQAAEILESFLAQCEGMGQCAGGSCGLRFSPSIAGSMQLSAQQLLAMMGFKPGMGTGSGMSMSPGGGSGFGAGVGAGGGSSAQRSPMSNVGLYGALPVASGMDNPMSGFMGDSGRRGFDRARPGTAKGAPLSESDFLTEFGAAGSGGITIPFRYRHRVGEYFRRVAEELDQ